MSPKYPRCLPCIWIPASKKTPVMFPSGRAMFCTRPAPTEPIKAIIGIVEVAFPYCPPETKSMIYRQYREDTVSMYHHSRPTSTMTPVIMTTPMPVAMGSYNRTRGGPRCRPASACDRSTDDSTSHGAASSRTLSHDIRYRHGDPNQQPTGTRLTAETYKTPPMVVARIH